MTMEHLRRIIRVSLYITHPKWSHQQINEIAFWAPSTVGPSDLFPMPPISKDVWSRVLGEIDSQDMTEGFLQGAIEELRSHAGVFQRINSEGGKVGILAEILLESNWDEEFNDNLLAGLAELGLEFRLLLRSHALPPLSQQGIEDI